MLSAAPTRAKMLHRNSISTSRIPPPSISLLTCNHRGLLIAGLRENAQWGAHRVDFAVSRLSLAMLGLRLSVWPGFRRHTVQIRGGGNQELRQSRGNVCGKP